MRTVPDQECIKREMKWQNRYYKIEGLHWKDLFQESRGYLSFIHKNMKGAVIEKSEFSSTLDRGTKQETEPDEI